MSDECHGALDLSAESLDFTHGFSWTLHFTAYAMYSFQNDSVDGTTKGSTEGKSSTDRYASVALRYLNDRFEAVFVVDTTNWVTKKRSPVITRAVKPVPSGGGYKAPKLLCLKLRTIVVSS